MPKRSSTPTLLISALILLTLLVGAFSIGLRTIFFPPYFRGWGEVTARHTIDGWAVNERAPYARVEVQLFIDGQLAASTHANLSRPDVLAAGFAADEWCGYSFTLPPLPAGTHEARVYALHKVGRGSYRTLQLMGDPLKFDVAASQSRASANCPALSNIKPLPSLLVFMIHPQFRLNDALFQTPDALFDLIGQRNFPQFTIIV
jgi:hypothetical protein